MGSDRTHEPVRRGRKAYATPDRGAKRGGQYKFYVPSPSSSAQYSETCGEPSIGSELGRSATESSFTSIILELPCQSTSPKRSIIELDSKDGTRGILNPNSSESDNLVDAPDMPKRSKWKSIVESYLEGLHPSKRTKALITQDTYNKIFMALRDPESTRVGTAQFRFWVRRMFRLSNNIQGVQVVTHEGQQVAIKENVYDILCTCHTESDHGGRDRTVKTLHKYYTWVPKELVANFVKACPVCIAKKRGTRSEGHVASLGDFNNLTMGAPQYCVASIEDFGRLPTPSRDLDTEFILPPLNSYTLSVTSSGRPSCESSGINRLTAACLEFANEEATVLNNTVQHKSVLPPPQTILPPLMKYLSQDTRSEMQQHQNPMSPEPVSVPIDPALLSNVPQQDPTSRHDYSRESYVEHPPNALDLQLYPPPPVLDSTVGRLTMGPSYYTWKLQEEPEVYVNNDSSKHTQHSVEPSMTHSASSLSSIGLPTPSSSIGQVSPEHVYLRYLVQNNDSPQDSPSVSVHNYQYMVCESSLSSIKEHTRGLDTVQGSSDTPLFSPVPVKYRDTSAMMELVSGSSLQGP